MRGASVYTPRMHIWFAANELPRISGTDEAIWRRLRVIPFDVVIPESERDLHLDQKLLAEAQGILRWLVDGCRKRIAAGRLVEPQAVIEATAAYRASQDPLGRFLAESVVKDPKGWEASEDVFDAHLEWCEDNYELPVTPILLGRRLKAEGFKSLKQQRGACRDRGWQGLRLSIRDASSDRRRAALRRRAARRRPER